MASIPELLNGHVTLEVECLDRLFLNGYAGSLATAGGLVYFMREQLGKPIPSPVVLGQVTDRFREDVTAMAAREQIPIYASVLPLTTGSVVAVIRTWRALGTLTDTTNGGGF